MKVNDSKLTQESTEDMVSRVVKGYGITLKNSMSIESLVARLQSRLDAIGFFATDGAYSRKSADKDAEMAYQIGLLLIGKPKLAHIEACGRAALNAAQRKPTNVLHNQATHAQLVAAGLMRTIPIHVGVSVGVELTVNGKRFYREHSGEKCSLTIGLAQTLETIGRGKSIAKVSERNYHEHVMRLESLGLICESTKSGTYKLTDAGKKKLR